MLKNIINQIAKSAIVKISAKGLTMAITKVIVISKVVVQIAIK